MDAGEVATVLGRPAIADLDFHTLPRTTPTWTNSYFKLIREKRHEQDCKYEEELYTERNLNEQQKRIYRYMCDNVSAIVMIQAGPGTGKTFTQLTLARAWKKTVNVIIFKHDLLHTFRNCGAERFTVAKFCMKLWNLNFAEWCGLECQLSGRMSANQFVNCVVGLLRRADMTFCREPGSIVLLDEYTVIPKPVLFALLALFKHAGIGTVITGDKNQLQNIHNSVHVGQCSSYDIATAFADRTYTLTKNERCGDDQYNRLVDYVSRFSSDKRLDKFGYALAAALFHRKFMGESAVTDTHLASHHRDLASMVHMMTVNGDIPVSFYFINASAVKCDLSRVQGVRQRNGLYLPNPTVKYMQTRAPDKYLPYIPLVIGCRYFVLEHSEHVQFTLESVDEERETVTLRSDDGVLSTLTKQNCNGVMFDKHRRFLLNNGDDSADGPGQLYNYPIYMANVMSIHMCQGRTITNAVDIVLNDSTYQGFYVSVSRVTSPQQITRVIVPDMPAHLLSTVVNFPQLCSRPDGTLTVDELDSCFGHNYLHYPIRDAELTGRTMYSLGRFFTSRDADTRHRIRDELCRSVANINPEVLNKRPKIGSCVENGAVMTLVLRYKYTVLALSLLETRDSAVWLHEFMRQDPLVTLLGTFGQNTAGGETANDERFNLTRVVCGLAEHGYEPYEDTLSYVKRHARWRTKDGGRAQHYIEENTAMGTVLETSKFQLAVYRALSADSLITIAWLMDRLRTMVEDLCAASTDSSSETDLVDDNRTATNTSDAAATTTANTTITTTTTTFDIVTSLRRLLDHSTMRRGRPYERRVATTTDVRHKRFSRQRRII